MSRVGLESMGRPAKPPEAQLSTYHAPGRDEESDVVAQFLTRSYPSQDDDDQEHGHGELGVLSMYWPEEPGHHAAGHGACYWSQEDSSNSNGNGSYFDGYYLSELNVSLGINTLSTTAIDLNVVGEERKAIRLVPNPPLATDRAGCMNRDFEASTVRSSSVSHPGWNKKRVRASDKGKKVESKKVRKCLEENRPSSTSCYCSDHDDSDDLNCSQKNDDMEGHVTCNAKARAGRRSMTDHQSLYIRKRRERINQRLRILQNMVPNGTKVDISTMLEEAAHYVKFLQLQIKLLSSDELWMYAPIAYDGMNIGIDMNISPPQ